MNDGGRRADFLVAGFAVLRGAVDAVPLTVEVDRALADGFRRGTKLNTGSGQNYFRYVPMMCERTPVSVSLVSDLALVAAELLGRVVLPVRAKGTEYFGETAWHRDSELPILASVGLAAYLDHLDDNSAFPVRVVLWCGSEVQSGADSPARGEAIASRDRAS